MYHPTSISSLTPSQISKALKGLPVRVSTGNHHNIELSADQIKKFAKAGLKGKASTITLDPYQIQNHMHLLGSGVGRRNKYNKWVDALGARDLISSGMSKGESTISGSSVGRRNKYNKWVDALGARDLISSGMSKGASTISGSGNMRDLHTLLNSREARKASNKYGPDMGKSHAFDDEVYGFGVGRRNKYNKWVDALGARDVINAGMSKGASTISGVGVRKRGRPRKSGGALMAAGM